MANELRIGQFNVAYATNFQRLEDGPQPPRVVDKGISTEGPFCCVNIAPYKFKFIDHEREFKDFVQHRGNYPTLLFEVKRQINNGPLLSKRYFTLKDNQRKEVVDPAVLDKVSTMPKVNAFKNYKCEKHGLFFGVDLYKLNATGIHNAHHQRVLPYTSINQPVLDQFFQAAKIIIDEQP